MCGRSLFALLILATLASDECPPPSGQKVSPAPAKLAATIEIWLKQDYAQLEGGEPVLGLVYSGPEAGGLASVSLRLVPDGILPTTATRPERPSDVLQEVGYYLGTFTTKGQPRYLARLGEPSAVLGESAVNGELRAVLQKRDQVVVAGRFPYVQGDLVAMFDTGGGKVTQVRLEFDLRNPPPWARSAIKGLVRQ